ncbi:MAG: serine protease [Patescibacteria group bacterium]
MEDLNKSQLILLALLVSFVTSIATGVVTVSLMEQAPQSVTQTINKVVTQTIERVTKEPAVVIKAVPEEDLIASAVENNAKGIVKIKLGQEGDIVGAGIVLSSGGIIASDVNPSDFAEEAKYYGIFSDGKEFPLAIISADKGGFSLFSAEFGNDKKNVYIPNTLTLGDSDKIKLGQTVLVIAPSGDLQKGIISGLVRDIITEGNASSTEETSKSSPSKETKTIKLIKISIALSKDNSGSPLVNLGGVVVGITIYREGVRVAIPSNLIKESIANQALPKKEQ